MEMNTQNKPVAIQISGVKKMYRLGQIGGGTLTADLQSWWARIRGKEDPNVRIGTDQRLFGKTFMALNGIDLTVYKGEALGIIGGNGAGKSTMLKLLSRVTAPTEGTIDLYGRIASMLEVGTGFNGEMTGRENIYMNGAILGMTKAEIDAKMEDIIEFSEVREFIDTPVKRYSSGMYVKLAFSVAAHLDSEIMIMDEVLAVGDMAFQKKCLDKMRDAAKKEGRTVLYVSHNMNTIRQLCDRCVVLNQGKVIYLGDVEEAIGVYMGNTAEASPYVDLTDKARWVETAPGLKLKSIEILDRDSWVLPTGEKLRFRICVKADRDISGAGYRHGIYNTDERPITLMCAPNCIHCKSGEEQEIVLEADISQLVPGQYFLTTVLYESNQYGGFTFLDQVGRAINFRVNTVMGFNDNMYWNQHNWGHVKLPDLTVLDVHTKSR
jgi:lipopolysaccharide transport system ATP-binding protein